METTLTEKQQLRAGLLKELGFDCGKAKQAYDFIINEDEATPSCQKVDKPDGVYYVLSDRSLISTNTNNAKSFSDSIIGVAVKMGDKIATVALHDANDGEDIALTKEGKSGTPDFYHNDSWDAISDWNGEANTKDYGDMLNPEIGLKEGEYTPSIAQLKLIFLNVKEVNKALVDIGGSPLRKTWYWSSTEYSSGYSWGMYFYDGYIYGNFKNYQFVVRPSVAYRL